MANSKAQMRELKREQLPKASAFAFSLLLSSLIHFTVGAPVASADEFYGFCETEPGHISSNEFATQLHQISNATSEASKPHEESIFTKACQDPRLLTGRPKTGLFQRVIPSQDSKGRSSNDFLKRVGKRILESMEAEELKLSVREDCLTGRLPKIDIGCRDTEAWFKNELTPLVKKARINLALAQTTGQAATLMKKAKPKLNSKLDSLGTHKEVDWSRLNFSEIIVAGDILNEYKAEMREATALEVREKRVKPEDAAKFENDGLLAARFTNGLTYVELLSRNPILQYLSQSYSSELDVARAISKMREHLRSDRATAENAIKEISKDGSRHDSIAAGLKLLDYTSHVEAELLESPEDCGLATSLLKVNESRKLGNTLAIGLPLVVASLALPIAGQVAAGAAVGVAGGLGYSVYTYSEMVNARERFISRISADDSTDYNRLNKADREFKISLAMGPAALMLAPAARFASLGFRAAKVGSSLSRSTAKK